MSSQMTTPYRPFEEILTAPDATNLRNEEWTIAINSEPFHFTRQVRGPSAESSRLVGQAEASVWAAAIVRGFEPPRHFRRGQLSSPPKRVTPPEFSPETINESIRESAHAISGNGQLSDSRQPAG
jgi:hypothetical protein